ncbi:MAG: RidA family protein [Betaproteobacteria bacterium]|nr:RidA family protein [Betaproteobacteria bacterium]
MRRTNYGGPFEAERAYSPMVKTTGGSLLWLAGTTGVRDERDKQMGGEFEAQVRQCFRNIEVKLQKTGATLSNLVSMTVFISDPRFGPQFLKLRKEILKDNFLASALITVSGFADPMCLVEIQSVAVVDE